jgi:hypothetical protein
VRQCFQRLPLQARSVRHKGRQQGQEFVDRTGCRLQEGEFMDAVIDLLKVHWPGKVAYQTGQDLFIGDIAAHVLHKAVITNFPRDGRGEPEG